MISSRYKIEQKLGKGSFATVYNGIDTKTNTQVAIKLVENSMHSIYSVESKVFTSVSGRPHFPKLYWNGDFEKGYAFVMELLGTSLADILISRPFHMASILELGLQMLTALETMHILSFIHRDIKPDNILTGPTNQELFYLVDYGLSKNYIDSATKHHAPMREDTAFKGNLVFCSKNILSGISASRRDDIESLFLLLIYLIKKELPWINEKKNLECMIGRRSSVNFNQFMKGLPSEILEIFNYSQSLSYYQAPNYSWIREKLINLKSSIAMEQKIIPALTDEPKLVKKKSYKRAKTAGARRKTLCMIECETIIAPPPDFSKGFRQKIIQMKKSRNKTEKIN